VCRAPLLTGVYLRHCGVVSLLVLGVDFGEDSIHQLASVLSSMDQVGPYPGMYRSRSTATGDSFLLLVCKESNKINQVQYPVLYSGVYV
jgi:hypothetical protein